MPTFLRQQAYPFDSLRKDPHWSVQGLVFYSQFKPAGKLIDESLYGNDGVITGATWAGNALSFNGTSDYVDIGSGPSIEGTTNFTVSAWVKVVGDTGVQNQRIVMQRDNVHWNGVYRFYYNENQDRFEFSVRGTDASESTVVYTPTVSQGIWYHVVGVRNGTTGSIYLDGVKGFDRADFDKALNDNLRTGIGVDLRDSAEFFKGLISDVSIYKRALSASEIAALYLNPDLPMQQPPIWLFTPPMVSVNPKGPLGHPLYGPFAGPLVA